MRYEPTFESIMQHPVPQWYDDAKFGIFIHWGLYSVPGWAPDGADIDKQVEEKGWEAMFANNPYAEWYLNGLRIGDTQTRRHHIATYGANFSYDDFAPIFDQAVERWNPDEWAELFQKVGARYAVLTTKHHDGFLLWPSALTSPHKPGKYAARRDLVGDLTASIRRRGMKMGLYYSGGLDWTFDQTPIRDVLQVNGTIVQSQEFIDYANAHWRELIDRYAPSILWNDIGAPAHQNLPELFAYYYNTVPEGVVDDRWSQETSHRDPASGQVIGPPSAPHSDFTTPEYARYSDTVAKKWEGTRGIGHSFGYNQNEDETDYLSVEELVRSFVDIVSKNGNLLLDVGPMANGTIPALQRERLLGMGAWLDVNGEAIFGSRPWITAMGAASENVPVRFTQKDGSLYAILLDTPRTSEFTLENLHAAPESTISLLGNNAALTWTQGDHLTVTLPNLPASPAHTLKITPAPIR
ncbi:MAG TPA: alpha-L-fucosidase [Phototrophicaceae bacterium]|nr:alpha-L-fucosidase [Phototrophicaceae bacterium]